MYYLGQKGHATDFSSQGEVLDPCKVRSFWTCATDPIPTDPIPSRCHFCEAIHQIERADIGRTTAVVVLAVVVAVCRS